MVTFHIQESLFCFKNWMLPIFLELFPQPWLSRTMLWLKHNFPNKHKQQTFLPKEISSGDFFNQRFAKTRVDIILLCFDIIKPSSLDALLIKSSASSNLFSGKNNLHLLNFLALKYPSIPDKVPRLLIGCKSDLVTHTASVSVSRLRALHAARRLGAVLYVETEAVKSASSSIATFEVNKAFIWWKMCNG